MIQPKAAEVIPSSVTQETGGIPKQIEAFGGYRRIFQEMLSKKIESPDNRQPKTPVAPNIEWALRDPNQINDLVPPPIRQKAIY